MKYRLDTDSNSEQPVGVTATDINGAEISAPSQGQAPAKLIVNKVGRTQTVYYRPDKKSKSK
jgi:hypothetical protein